VVAQAGKTQERLVTRLLQDAKARVGRLASKLPAMEVMKSEMTQKVHWNLMRWKDLAGLMEERRKEKVKRVVDEIVEKIEAVGDTLFNSSG